MKSASLCRATRAFGLGAATILALLLAACASPPDSASATAKGSKSAVIYPAEPPIIRDYDPGRLFQESSWTTNNVHDAHILKAEGAYWVYSTDVMVGGRAVAGGQIRKSLDLIHWEWVGRVFDGVPAEARAWCQAEGIWAPDPIQLADGYHLYYSASRFGSQKSCIGHATAPHPAGPWTDRGILIRSDAGAGPNAIDGNPIRDKDGGLWLAYGSFFGGIYLVKLDRATGGLADSQPGRLIAQRPASVSNAAEGPYIIWNPRFQKYYLFLSYDSLFTDYNIRVGRSERIEGPYLDALGKDLADTTGNPVTVGTKLMGGYQFPGGEAWLAPGHNSVLRDGEAWFLIHHARGARDKNWPWLNIRKLVWSNSGWPLASPETYAGEIDQPISADAMAGNWEILAHQAAAWSDPVAHPVKLLANGTVSDTQNPDLPGKWQSAGDRGLTINLGESRIEAKLLAAWDSEHDRPTLVFTGIDQNGTTWWGKQTAIK